MLNYIKSKTEITVLQKSEKDWAKKGHETKLKNLDNYNMII